LQDRKPFHNKRVERRTERERQKRSVRKAETKARLRGRFEARLSKLTESMRKFTRVRGAADRERLLRSSLLLLDACLEEKPQSHLLRVQRQLCLDALSEIVSNPSKAGQVQLTQLLDDPDGIRLVLKARVHPPASDRRSRN